MRDGPESLWTEAVDLAGLGGFDANKRQKCMYQKRQSIQKD